MTKYLQLCPSSLGFLCHTGILVPGFVAHDMSSTSIPVSGETHKALSVRRN